MIFRPVENLSQVLQVRMLRNSCCEYLTNHRKHIGILGQLRWYFRYYRSANNSRKYRLYLGYDDRGLPVGYGALSLEAGELMVTECVAAEYRGRGYGRLILDHLIGIGTREKRNLVGEIWSTNVRSIALHENAGFKLDSSDIKGGQEIRRYLLATNAVESGLGNASDRSRVVA